jgi:hypothetical protein
MISFLWAKDEKKFDLWSNFSVTLNKMTSCEKLAKRYAAETGQSIPSKTASAEVRSDWLLTSEWGCYEKGTTTFHDKTWCLENNNPAVNPAQEPNGAKVHGTLATRPPYLNVLNESGFLAWTNSRGLQCINRIVGNFYGLNIQTGLANVPGPSVSPPNSQCWGACFNATSSSETCFECVNQVLTVSPSLCPDINVHNPADENIIQESILCHECIGLQGTFIQSKAANATPITPDLTAIINNMWACVEGFVPAPWSTATIVILIVVGVFLVTCILTLGLYFGYFHPKIVKKQKELERLQAAHIDPDTL